VKCGRNSTGAAMTLCFPVPCRLSLRNGPFLPSGGHFGVKRGHLPPASRAFRPPEARPISSGVLHGRGGVPTPASGVLHGRRGVFPLAASGTFPPTARGAPWMRAGCPLPRPGCSRNRPGCRPISGREHPASGKEDPGARREHPATGGSAPLPRPFTLIPLPA
jgi:hypothetical protein